MVFFRSDLAKSGKRIGNALFYGGSDGMAHVIHPANTEDEEELEEMRVYNILDYYGDYDIVSTVCGVFEGEYSVMHTTDLPWVVFIA